MKIFVFLRKMAKGAWLMLYRIEVLLKAFWWKLVGGKTPPYHDIPIIINNFNRLDFLKKLISSLETRGYKNLIILDNDSTYPPLLEYYKTTPYEVIFLHENVGFLALWKSGIYKRFKNNYYVYTDSDVMLDEGCPEDFMKVFLSVLKKHPACMKVGFGIRIDDLPDCYKQKNYVIRWEAQHWKERVDDLLIKARIDTTFALYRPFCKGGSTPHLIFRTDFPYVIRHLPWYEDTDNLTEEEKYYISHSKKATHWTESLK